MYIAKNDAEPAWTAIKQANKTLREVCRTKPVRKAHEVLTLTLLARAIKSARSAMALAEQGYGEDACVIARIIYELLQHVAYINEKSSNPTRRTKVFWLEGVLDGIEDAESFERHYRECGTPVTPSSEIKRIRKKVRSEPEFKEPNGGMVATDRRWRYLKSPERLQILENFLDDLDPTDHAITGMLTFDFCVRIIGNRHVHVLPASLNAVVSWKTRGIGPRELAPNCGPSRVFTEIVPEVIILLMLAFSRTIALLFFRRSDNLPQRTARDMDEYLKARAKRQDRKNKNKPSPQVDYNSRVHQTEEAYRQCAGIRT